LALGFLILKFLARSGCKKIINWLFKSSWDSLVSLNCLESQVLEFYDLPFKPDSQKSCKFFILQKFQQKQQIVFQKFNKMKNNLIYAGNRSGTIGN
jgi:hypothetical protein